MSQPRSYLQFDGMVWPDPRDPTEVQWRLRYGDPTRRDHVRAASVLSAYAHLISMPRRLRDKRIRQLRAAMAANPPGEDTVPPDTDKQLHVVHAAYAEGWWGLTVPGVPGAVTQVRNLSDADKWASEAIAFVTGASLDDLVIEIVIVGGLAVPPEILRALDGLSARPARPARILPCPICGAPDGFHDGPPHTDTAWWRSPRRTGDRWRAGPMGTSSMSTWTATPGCTPSGPRREVSDGPAHPPRPVPPGR